MQNQPSITVKIDWITATKSYDSMRIKPPESVAQANAIARNIARSIPYCNGEKVTRSERHVAYYEHIFNVGDLLQLAISERQSQGVKILITGSQLAVGQEEEERLWNDLRHGDWNLTRVDVAYDFFNFGRSLLWIMEKCLYRQVTAKKHAAVWRLTPNGDTIEIGSRSSEKWLKIYEKGKEQRTEYDWLRVELELKGRVVKTLKRSELEEVYRRAAKYILTMSGNLPDFMNDFFIEFSHGAHNPQLPRKSTKNSRELWLMTQVMPALVTTYHEEPQVYRRFVEALTKELEKRERMQTE